MGQDQLPASTREKSSTHADSDVNLFMASNAGVLREKLFQNPASAVARNPLLNVPEDSSVAERRKRNKEFLSNRTAVFLRVLVAEIASLNGNDEPACMSMDAANVSVSVTVFGCRIISGAGQALFRRILSPR